MEKRKPHYPLPRVKALIQDGSYRVTRTALQCAARDFGLVETRAIAQCVLNLNSREFYKSMTTLYDSKLWQDVYHPMVAGLAAYVKVQIVEDSMLIISFKLLEED